jgi:hypothetical protein
MKTLAVAFSLVFLAGCGLCNNTVKNTAASPDGEWVATAVVRDCGATTDYSPQVHLLKPGKSVWGIGNVFVGDHSSQIKVKWLSATNLMIYSDCKVSKHVTNYHGITIAHQEKEPTSN